MGQDHPAEEIPGRFKYSGGPFIKGLSVFLIYFLLILLIKHVITVRRIMYLKNILNKHEDEVVSKVYSAMKNSPLKGDWYNLIQSDFEKIGMTLDEKCIKEADFITFKNHVKKSVWAVWFKELEEKKLKHTKVQNIKYDGIRRPQSYLTNPNFDN